MSGYRRMACALFAALVLTTTLTAQSGDDINEPSASDIKEIHDYVLSMNKIHEVATATKALDAVRPHDPDLDQLDEARSIDAKEKILDKYADAVAAIRQNGLTPREYLDCLITLMQASQVVGLKESGRLKEYPPDVLQAVSRTNLNFTEQHWAELQKIINGESGQ